jgi:hypothetical protein
LDRRGAIQHAGLRDLAFFPCQCRTSFCNLHDETGKVPEDRIIFFSCRLHCEEDMDLVALLGYDGPVRLWIDSRAAFADPGGTNPALIDKSRTPFHAAAGDHEVVVALNTNLGRAWGIYLRFERTDIDQDLAASAPQKVILPLAATAASG